MIRIYKDNDTKVVTKGAYEQFYKSLGYKLILDVKEETKENVETSVKESVETTVTKPKRVSSSKRNKKDE